MKIFRLIFSILFITLLVVYAVVHAQEEKKVQVPTVYLTLIQNIPKFRETSFKIGKVLPADRNICGGLIPEGKPQLIHLLPKTPGLTSVTVYDIKDAPRVVYQVQVITAAQGSLISELEQFLGDIEGIEIRPIGDKVSVGGQIILPQDIIKILSIYSQAKFQNIILTAELSPLSKQLIAEKIKKEIEATPKLKSVASGISVKFIKNNLQLMGVVDNKSQRDDIEIIATAYLPSFIIPRNMEGKWQILEGIPHFVWLIDIKEKEKEVPQAPTMVKITVRYVEMNKNYLKQFGVDWGPGIKDTSEIEAQFPANIIGTVTGTINSLIPKLKTAKELGLARELQAFEILITDKKMGEIHNVTNIPYPVIGKEGQEGTEFAEAGLKSMITPTLIGDKENRIQLDVDFVLKTLAGFTNNRPSITENKIKTTLSLKEDQSSALGGLVTASLGKEYDRLPKTTGVSDPLFRLFRSKSFRDNKSQFVIFITPTIMTDVKVSSEASRVGEKFNIKVPEMKPDEAKQ